ncbi:MAG TPA: CsgG/HfaB family protein [Elusimicrobiota bacterium]|jgi:hypothetical protein|nr:CsgG/HfaB family protein [Elusimicrobiota bacterium]
MVKGLLLGALAAALAACAAPAFVIVSPDYDASRVRRVALLAFDDFPGAPGSGEIVAGTFEKYLLLGGYGLVERRRVNELLREQAFQSSGAVDPATLKRIGQLLGVDALAFGGVSDFSNSRDQTVIVDMPQEQSEPIYGSVETVQRSGDTMVRTTQNVVTGYAYRHTSRPVAEVETIPARVGVSVRLVSVDTGQVLWSGSASSSGSDLASAAEEASSQIMQAVARKLKKRA